MRKIERTEKKEKRQKINQMILGIGLIVLMIGSSIGFAVVFNGGNSNDDSSDNTNSLDYNGVNFVKNQNGFWQFESLGKVFQTYSSPELTENTPLDFQLNIDDYSNKPLYYVFDNSSIALNELQINFGEIVLRQSKACLDQLKCSDENLIVKTCEDNVIIIKPSEEIKAYKEGNCVFIEGNENQQLLLADKLIYNLLKIQ